METIVRIVTFALTGVSEPLAKGPRRYRFGAALADADPLGLLAVTRLLGCLVESEVTSHAAPMPSVNALAE